MQTSPTKYLFFLIKQYPFYLCYIFHFNNTFLKTLKLIFHVYLRNLRQKENKLILKVMNKEKGSKQQDLKNKLHLYTINELLSG